MKFLSVDRPWRSDCPINMAVEILGDRWTVIVLRDIMFGDRKTYSELLASDEAVASNILIDRLSSLTCDGIIRKSPDRRPGARFKYTLTEAGIALLPTLVCLGEWGGRYLPAAPELKETAHRLYLAGPKGWEKQMQKLRSEHLNLDRQ